MRTERFTPLMNATRRNRPQILRVGYVDHRLLETLQASGKLALLPLRPPLFASGDMNA